MAHVLLFLKDSYSFYSPLRNISYNIKKSYSCKVLAMPHQKSNRNRVMPHYKNLTQIIPVPADTKKSEAPYGVSDERQTDSDQRGQPPL
jgi:hypothetical protein